MENPEILHPDTLAMEFQSDPRRQLIERILRTGPFQKSSRLPTLLRYLAEHSMGGHPEELSEQRIGTAVFGKPAGYSPVEDSAVRVHVRQLRLRLHEYFDSDGREETLVVDIPKGSYEMVFHSAQVKPLPPVDAPPAVPDAEPKGRGVPVSNFVFWAALVSALVCGFGWYHAVNGTQRERVPWPLNEVIQRDKQTSVVVSDGSTMLRLLTLKEFSLEEYLQPNFLLSLTPPQMDENVARLAKYISNSEIASFADVMMASTVMKLAGPDSDRLVLYPARDLNRRDLEQGNYVFVGGPTSNPWVTLFADSLNFKVVEDVASGKMYFLNKKPLPGELHAYEGLRSTGSGGEDYATISLLPNRTGQGNVLILQGIREEGTEALAVLLADDKDRLQLKQRLNVPNGSKSPVYFEALVRAQTVAGAPVSISIIATRSISPDTTALH